MLRDCMYKKWLKKKNLEAYFNYNHEGKDEKSDLSENDNFELEFNCAFKIKKINNYEKPLTHDYQSLDYYIKKILEEKG